MQLDHWQGTTRKALPNFSTTHEALGTRWKGSLAITRPVAPLQLVRCRFSGNLVSCRYISATRTSSATVPAAPQGRIFIFGLGFVGIALGAALQRQGWHVSGTCRDEEACASFRSEGVDAHVLDDDDELCMSTEAKDAVAAACHILSTVPPAADFNQDPVLLTCRPLLVDLARSVKWVGYISSTGVYGDHNGEWVDESSKTRADGGKNLARLRAEQAWMSLHQEHGLPLHIFRLGGIYGPGRSALEAARQQGVSVSQERRAQQRYTARCHVHDICSVLQASMNQPSPGSIYNVVDDEPASRVEVMAYARHLLGLDSGQEAAAPEPVPHKAAGENGRPSGLAEKRVLNEKIKRDLGVQLAFPSYREGLSAIAERDRRPYIV